MGATPPPRPLVTVALPVHNGAAYLEATLASLLGQDLEDLELLIGDNASTDATPRICRAVAARDPRVSYLPAARNGGAAWNYNRLAPLARGTYFKWAAHDDLCAPTLLSACVAELEASPAAVVAYPRTVLIGADGEVLDAAFEDGLDRREPDPVDRLRRYLRHQGEQHAVFGVVRTAALLDTRLIARCWGGDIPLLAELLLRGRFHEVDRRLFLRRYHPGSSMVANASARDVVRWFDPARGRRAAFPRTRLLGELLARVPRAPLPPADRGRAEAVVLGEWLPRYWRHMGGEAKLALRSAVRPHR